MIVARAGIFRDSLIALVSTIPYIDRIYKDDDITGALKRVINIRPALVLFDADLMGETVISILGEFKSQYPQAAYLVLDSNADQEEVFLRAGADAVLIRGIHADKLMTTVESILSRRFI